MHAFGLPLASSTHRPPPRVAPSFVLLAALLAGMLFALPAAADRRAAASVAQQIAAQSARMAERLQAAYAAVNVALKARAERSASYQAALKRRERAAGRVEQLKGRGERGLVLEQALREALVLDEEAQRSRAALLASEADVARLGAQLLEVFDAVLAEKAREVRALDAADPRRARSLSGYQRLADQRAGVRQALQPVLVQESASPAEDALASVRPRPDDDVETLLEKADLARDLEERFRRRAASVRQRIQEVEDERSLARDAVELSREASLFDERDYRPVFQSTQAGGGPQAAGGAPALLFGGGGAGVQAERSPEPPPPGAVEIQPPSDPPGQFGGEAPAPTDGLDPTADADNADVSEAVRGDDGPAGGGGASPPPPSGAPPPMFPAEQVFLGAGAASDAQLRALIAGDELSVEQLKALEKRLLSEARAMRTEAARLRTQLGRELKASDERR